VPRIEGTCSTVLGVDVDTHATNTVALEPFGEYADHATGHTRATMPGGHVQILKLASAFVTSRPVSAHVAQYLTIGLADENDSLGQGELRMVLTKQVPCHPWIGRSCLLIRGTHGLESGDVLDRRLTDLDVHRSHLIGKQSRREAGVS